jgi:gamma-glutamyltranspeptidase/glutathione hydrolase
MLQAFLNMVEFGMNPQQAIEQPRISTWSFPNSFWPHAYHPGLLNAEARIPEAVRDDLSRRGHRVEPWPDWTPQACGVCAIAVDHDKGSLTGGADPRRESYAIGW